MTVDPILKELKEQILIDLTPEGLRIQLVDTEQRPMFEIGSARVAPYMSTLLRTLAPMLNELPNRIQITGHTDSRPYAGGEAGYSNWELSAERANASRRELVNGGLASEKLLRASGMSDRIPFQGPDRTMPPTGASP
ncbi:OmpA family protein [Azotobacter chroococcum]